MDDSDAHNAHSLLQVEDCLWVVSQSVGMARYDFSFKQFFACRCPMRVSGRVRAVARMGAAEDYRGRFDYFAGIGVDLVHSPEEYERTSYLANWYPLISDLTPRSVWYDTVPSAREIESLFRWPVFIKGSRQTSRHQRKTSIIDSAEGYERAMELWRADAILSWQQLVCREFVPLRLVGEQSAYTLPRAFEFRSFWWKGICVGIGPYWQDQRYELTAAERAEATAVAGEAARRIDVTFLVVDVAQTADGKWIVIECNDGQDSGYAGCNPLFLWRQVLNIEGAAR